MTREIRIGAQIQPQHADYQQIRAAVDEAEEAGADVIFNWDHFFPLCGEPDGKHFECWTMLAAWAEATSRVEIGALVTCNSYRNPELLADMARTVDHISGGRLILGIGVGLVRARLPRVRLRVRHRRQPARPSWAPRCRGSRRGWAKLNPAPTRDIPILIGGGGEKKTLRLRRRARRHLARLRRPADRAAQERRARLAGAPSWAATRRRSSARSKVTEPPEQVADELLAAGFTQFTVSQSGPDYDLALLRQWLAWREKQGR